jgi:Putative beta-barrel porin-2, OmpL-like. bbp2
MTTRRWTWVAAGWLIVGFASVAAAQEKTPAETPKTFWQELAWFAYVENSYVFNLRGEATNGSNELRFYDVDRGYTFNMAEFSVKKDPSDRYPFGFGLVLTGGEDAQFNHAIGIFRSADEAPTDTEKVDLQEAYLSYKVPLGTGLTVKAGKFVTLLGYEVIESPNNLNFSRSLLFDFATPLTHVGMLGSYALTDTLSATVGLVLGWDVANDRNHAPSGTGQLTYTGVKDLSTSVNFIVGPERNGDTTNIRWVVDLVANYTGLPKTTLGANFDYGQEADAAPNGGAASWWGLAGYAAYDWTAKLRTAARFEYFRDEDGFRTGFGRQLGVLEGTLTFQYKIWKGLVVRLEYRRDEADGTVFNVKASGPTSRSQDTLAIDLYYLFF